MPFTDDFFLFWPKICTTNLIWKKYFSYFFGIYFSFTCFLAYMLHFEIKEINNVVLYYRFLHIFCVFVFLSVYLVFRFSIFFVFLIYQFFVAYCQFVLVLHEKYFGSLFNKTFQAQSFSTVNSQIPWIYKHKKNIHSNSVLLSRRGQYIW